MKMNNETYTISKDISYRTYFENTKKSKSFIMNSSNYTIMSLSGISSDLWNLITKSDNYDDLYNFAKGHKVLDELDDFLENLENHGLIVFDVKNKKHQTINNKNEQTQNNKNNIDTTTKEINDYFEKNNLIYNLYFELTYRCNLKCIHCYNEKGSQTEITFEDAKKVIDEAYELGLFEVTLSGGECTIVKDFIRIASYVKEKHLVLNIITNGQYLYDNEDLFNELIKIKPDKVGISLYSLDKNKHEKITQVQGSLKKTISTIKKLRNNNINVQIKSFMMNINADGYKEIIRYSKALKTELQIDVKMLPQYDKDNRKELQCSDKQLYDFYTDKRSPLCITNLDFSKKKKSNDWICRGGVTFLCISPFFEVAPCVSMQNYKEDLHNKSLTEIWKNKDKNGELYEWRKLNKYKNVKCNKNKYCKYCTLCTKNYMASTDIANYASRKKGSKINNTDILICRLAKIKLRAMERIKNA